MIQAVLHTSLRHRVLRLAHQTPISGHPGQTSLVCPGCPAIDLRLHRILQRSYYWPHMVADISKTVRECPPPPHRTKNRLSLLRKASNRSPSTYWDRFGRALAGLYLCFLSFISDCFTKLTEMVPLKRITAYDVALAFVEHWVFKYDAPATLLSDNGSQFVAHFFRRMCNILQVHNIFSTTYHPQTNGQVERFNRILAAMLRCSVEDNPGLWCLYAPFGARTGALQKELRPRHTGNAKDRNRRSYLPGHS